MSSPPVARRTFVIPNRLGLHARAAAQLVQLAARFASDLTISKDGEEVNGKSIMGLMMLAAGQGSTIEVTATGDDSQALLEALGELIGAKFNESQ
jgi:phosphocarrier protein